MASDVMIGKLRKWGNSMGLLLSKKELNKLGLKEHDEIMLTIQKKSNPLREMFGAMKFSKPTAELLKESRKNESKFW
ncbi:MAG: hypothetical protein IPJ89_00435 [Candidatus Iainarchaeum archaeon]|uniref:AbrB/MazE/SpoVT family DNA-binding domain-containing protein n=1 Tax=Candidatus Iainarchaeum sp. TaxID=3101447 RepID=A0A7T9DJW0_9ARCH|nr:MAG: hypothetical protein IPJ89_00435 [Candidatus Diapherotrites archaeon]